MNDDIEAIGLRAQLRYFAAHVGDTVTLFTGQVGDEGWFAPNFIPPEWDYPAGAGNGLQRYLEGENAVPEIPQALFDKVPDVRPLRALGLEELEGGTFCALVYDDDISINYHPLDGNLMGDHYGLIAFEVLINGVNQAFGFSSSTTPTVRITILDADDICQVPLELVGAPIPKSSSTPFDIDPSMPTDPAVLRGYSNRP